MKKQWTTFIGIILVVLTLTLPFYSAQALAATVSITKNQGEAGIPGFIDAEGDVWEVDVQIVDAAASIQPEDVEIQVGSSSDTFDSCTPSDLGAVCSYLSPLPGVDERDYAFQIHYGTLTPENGLIRADGSAPQVQFTGRRAWQEEGKLLLDFTVNDAVAERPCVGIAELTILADEQVLQTIPFPTDSRVCQYSFQEDTTFHGQVQSSLTGSGQRWIKVQARDRLGHTATSQAIPVQTDFVAPQINLNTLDLSVGQFIGTQTTRATMSVEITEYNQLPQVTAMLNGNEVGSASCERQDATDIWLCLWPQIEVPPQESLQITITALDEVGNQGTSSTTVTLTPDVEAPTIRFFGTDKNADDIHYVSNGKNTVILEVEDNGAGVNRDGVLANLAEIGGELHQAPDSCITEMGVTTCTWTVERQFGADSARIGLTKLEDRVGNSGELFQRDVIVDTSGPIVESIVITALGSGEEREYVQSQDRLRVELTVRERSGVVGLLGVVGLVSDAATRYPADALRDGVPVEDGWQVFTSEDACEFASGEWHCVFITDEIKSGPSSGTLYMMVEDVAGNKVQQELGAWSQPMTGLVEGSAGNYEFDILATAREENPDYWEVAAAGVQARRAFIDIDTVNLGPMNMPFDVTLHPLTDDASALSVRLVPDSCVPTGDGATTPPLARQLTYGGDFPTGANEPETTVILEFAPIENARELFGITADRGDFTGITFDYTCQLQIFTKIDDTAITTAEVQEVVLPVTFAFSELGAADEALAEKVKEKREQLKDWKVVEVLHTIVKWLDYIVRIYNIISNLIGVVQDVSAGLEPLHKVPIGEGIAVAQCFTGTGISQGLDIESSFFDTTMQVLTCQDQGADNWYTEWQNSIINVYNNIELTRDVDQPCEDENGNPIACQYAPVRSLRDNLPLSVLGLCLPGIIENVDELRQIQCRTLYCYEQEVPANVATIDSCDQLEGLLTCKYVWGEVWTLIPFSAVWDSLVDGLRRAVANPIAVAHTATIIGCGANCVSSGVLTQACNRVYWFWDVLDLIDNSIGTVQSLLTEFDGNPDYCSQVNI